MAVAIVLQFPGGTLEQYDEVMEKMGLASGENAPDGLHFHWVTLTDEGIRVTDVWETQEQFDAFAAESIQPITAEVGLPGPPAITTHEVHNHMAG